MNALAALTPGLDAGLDCGLVPRDAIASLGRLELPFDFEHARASLIGQPTVEPKRSLAFRFSFEEVPFEVRVERRGESAVIRLVGELGFLPFTIENARRRRRLRAVLAAARRASGLRWEITRQHEIQVSGESEMAAPLTPAGVIGGVVALLLRGRPYLDLVVAVAGEE